MPFGSYDYTTFVEDAEPEQKSDPTPEPPKEPTKEPKNLLKCILHGIGRVCKLCIGVSGVYVMWIVLHYGASQLYVELCVPKTMVGFLLSPFMSAAPHCQGLRWLTQSAATMIQQMWIHLGAWFCSHLLSLTPDTTLFLKS